MPYYRSIPGVTASYIDGSFPTAEPSGEPRIIILGTSETGQTYNLFQIIDFAAAASEFGATSELYRAAVEARRQYPGDQNVNIALMRIGGRQGSVVLTDSQATPATLQIRPITRDATVLENYHLIMTEESSPIRQRILLYDNVKGDFVYDSDLVESQDEGVIDVIDGGLDIYTTTTGTVATPTAGPLLSALVPGDFALGTGASAFGSVVVAAGSEGTSMTNIEKYAALQEAYQFLDYLEGDILVPAGVYADSPNVVDGTPINFANSTMPTVGQSTGTAQDALGYVWQYTYRGKPYTYFFDDPVIGNAAKLTHAELTGDIEPAAVTNRANAAVASELREANFAHQLASACYKASTTWATMLGIISVRSPDDHGPANVASWIGDLPGYEYVGDTLVIDGAAKNGVGLLGNKFHAGEDGYRTGQITGGTSEGYAYGGYIMTTGAALPPGDPYGIDDSDEALDLQSKPIDIGKHILVTAAWPLHVTEGYRGSLCNSLAAKIALTPENEEPIGVNGGMLDVNMTSQVRGPQINDLAKLRFVGLRFEPRVGQILVSVRTAAHPTSDWARLSTIRSVNRTLSALRSIAKPYIGKGFNALSLQSLQQSMDGFLQSDRKLGFNQGAVATLSYSTLDKIAGRLKIKLKMIPPFTLETIEVETTLAAEEAQLS